MQKSKKLRRQFPRRWPIFRLADALISLLPVSKHKKGILILRMFGIGDALLFRAVLEKYTEALNVSPSDITILGSTVWAAAGIFFEGYKVEYIDEKRFARNFLYRLQIMCSVRKRGFETAICGMRFRYPHVMESLMLASGAPERIVVEPRPNEKFDAMFAHYRPLMTRTIALPEVEKPRAKDGAPLPLMHEIEQQLAFLSVIAGKPITFQSLPRLNVPKGALPLVQAGERYAVLNVGASHEPRRWSLEHFFEIARRLMEQGLTAVLLGGPAETGLMKEIETFKQRLPAGQGAARFILSIGDLSFTGASQLVAGAELVVSNDSGLGHLAIMLGKPSVLMVGGGHFGSFMPYPAHLTPPRVRFLFHLMPCYHCNWNCIMMTAESKTFPCVSEISTERVWDAIKDTQHESVA